MSRSELTNPKDRLPDLRLRVAGAAREEGLRPAGGKRPILLFLHGASCRACRSYAAAVDAERLRGEGGVLRVVVASAWPGEDVETLKERGVTVLGDEEGRAARALAVDPPGYAVADEWGEVHFRAGAGDGHDFPSPDVLVEWLEYLAVRCPECEGEAY